VQVGYLAGARVIELTMGFDYKIKVLKFTLTALNRPPPRVTVRPTTQLMAIKDDLRKLEDGPGQVSQAFDTAAAVIIRFQNTVPVECRISGGTVRTP